MVLHPALRGAERVDLAAKRGEALATTIRIAVPAVGIPAIVTWTACYRRRFATRPA